MRKYTGPEPVTSWSLVGKPTTTYSLWGVPGLRTVQAQVWMLPIPRGHIAYPSRKLQAVGLYFRSAGEIARNVYPWEHIVLKPENDYYYKYWWHSEYWSHNYFNFNYFSGQIGQDIWNIHDPRAGSED